MAYGSVPFPQILLAQPYFEWHAALAQWQAKERICAGNDREWIALELVVENLLPLLVAVTRLLVIEGPCQVTDCAFPLPRGYLPTLRSIV